MGLGPRHACVGVGTHEALDDLELVRRPLVHRPGSGDVPSLEVRTRLRWLQVCGHAVALEERDEIGLVPGRDAPGHDPATVLRVGHAGGATDMLRSVAAGLSEHRRAPHDPGHQVDLGALGHRVVDRARDLLPLPTALPVHERCGDAHREVLAGDVKGMPELRRHGWQVVMSRGIGVVPAIHHHPAQGEVHKIAALEVLPRARVPERRQACNDELRPAISHGRPIQAEEAVHATCGRVQQHVSSAEECDQHLPFPSGRQDQRALAAVVVPEMQRPLGVGYIADERADATRGRPIGRFDLHHVGPQPCEQQPAMLDRLVTEFDHAQAKVRARLGRNRVSRVRQRAWIVHLKRPVDGTKLLLGRMH